MLFRSRDRREQDQARKLMNHFRVVYPNTADVERALFEFSPFCLSHGVGAMDLLIAATVVGQEMALVTKNMKHFEPILGRRVYRPY